MKLFDKVKNLFTEEVEEEKEIKREVRRVEIPSPRQERRVENPTSRIERREEPVVVSDVKPSILENQPVKEDKSFFFSDEDFEDLEKKEEKEIKYVKKEESKPYKGTKVTVAPPEEKKVFKPTPIISPVYGVLDKNYKKEDIISTYTPSSKRFYNSDKITVDDVRQRAFSNLEDDIKNDLFSDEIEEETVEIVDDLNMFNDEKFEDDSIEEEKTPRIDSEIDFNFDDETELLAKQLEEQKRKLDEINSMINDNSISKHKTVKDVDEYLYQDKSNKVEEKEDIDEIEEKADDYDLIEEELEVTQNLDEAFTDAMDDLEEATKKTPKEEKTKKDMSDSELFNLIDSMYEKGEDDDNE